MLQWSRWATGGSFNRQMDSVSALIAERVEGAKMKPEIERLKDSLERAIIRDFQITDSESILAAATKAILRCRGCSDEYITALENYDFDGWKSAETYAKSALEAAGVPALITECATHQQSSFHPDWSLLQATTESLREAVARIAAYEEAIQEAEAIMGDEYGDHFGGFMELVSKAREARGND